MARWHASAEGHRVVLVIATHGEWGEVPDDLAPGETLVHRREAETAESARSSASTASRLGYEDSGMTGWEQNSNPGSFHQAPVEEAAERLAAILREEQADVRRCDWHGNYGHPDHQGAPCRPPRCRSGRHRAGRRGDPQPDRGPPLGRDGARAGLQLGQEDDDFDIDGPADDGNPMGTEEHEITLAIDVSPFVWLEREAVMAHRSQVTDTSFFAEMPDEMFATSFGTEWFIERRRAGGRAAKGLVLRVTPLPRPPRTGIGRMGRRR